MRIIMANLEPILATWTKYIEDNELYKWCEQQFGKQFISTFNDFYFETEEQRNWFLLRWS